MSYEILIEGTEPIDDWMVCTVCLEVARTSADCGSDSSKQLQQPLRQYLTDNSIEIIEKNLREWGNIKGVRPAYKMLRSARYKCLLTLSRKNIG